MIKKVTRNNYRQYYKEYYGIDFGKEFAVHHIDMNRDNNDIRNLLLIPTKIHAKYHFYENAIEYASNGDEKTLFSMCISPYFSSLFSTDEFLYLINEVRRWYCLKEEVDCYIAGEKDEFDKTSFSSVYQKDINKYISRINFNKNI